MVQGQVVDGSLSMGHARALLGAPDIEELAGQVISRRLSVRETEKLARDRKTVRERAPATVKPDEANGGGGDADIAALERQLADLLGVTVSIVHDGAGGRVTLGYETLDQLDMICQRLTGETI